MSFGSDELHCEGGYTLRGLRVGLLFVTGESNGLPVNAKSGAAWMPRGWSVRRVLCPISMPGNFFELGCALRFADAVNLLLSEQELAHNGYTPVAPPDPRGVWLQRMHESGRYEPFPGSRVRTEAA